MRKRKFYALHALCFIFFGPGSVWAFPASTVFQLDIGGGDLKYTPDGRLLAVAKETSVVLLDAETLAQVGVLFEEYYGVGPMDFSPDGRLLALGAGAGAFSLWDVQSTEKRRRFGRVNVNLERAEAVAFSFDGRQLATLDTNNLVVRDIEAWQIIFDQRVYQQEGRRTFELLSTSDNRFIAIDSLEDDVEASIIHPEGGIILWDVLTGKDLVQLKGEKHHNWRNFTISPRPKSTCGDQGCLR